MSSTSSPQVPFSPSPHTSPPPAYPDSQLLLGVLQAALQVDALLLLERRLQRGRIVGPLSDHHIPEERTPALGQRDETRELPGGCLGECFPEVRLQVWQDLRRPSGDDLKLHGCARAQLAIELDEAHEIHRAVAQRDPLRSRAAGVLEDRAI